MHRRKAVKTVSLGTLGITAGLAGVASATNPARESTAKMRQINIFSKHLQWVGYDEMARLVKEIGFEGIDLTVRPKGHVEPENVERDLPKVAEAAAKHGVALDMMTTAIRSADDPLTDRILRTASAVGIKVYRLGWFRYDHSFSIEKNIETFTVELKKIGELNARYNIIGDYQNHSGTSAGSPVWDIYAMIKSVNPEHIGVQYDIRHAMVEGLKAWPLGLRLMASRIHSIDIKDFEYVKTEKGWDIQNVPLGKGAVDFATYFKLLEELKVKAPISIHYEYPLGGADHGRTELTMPREQVLKAMKTDVQFLRTMLSRL